MDKRQLEQAYDRLKNTVYRIALTYCRSPHDAEDITHEVFLTLYAADKAFPTAESENAWVIRVTVNKCKNLLKRFDNSRRADLEEASGYYTIPADDPVHLAMNSLPDKYRIVVFLHYIEGYSVREIAELTSAKQSAVQVQLHRARKMLKKILREEID